MAIVELMGAAGSGEHRRGSGSLSQRGFSQRPVHDGGTLTPQQVAEIRRAKLGDIEDHADGYMANVFLPGVFKHGSVYVGSSEELGGYYLHTAPRTDATAQRLKAHIETTTLADGQPTDPIEAITAGVTFRSLDNLLGGNASRVVVLLQSFRRRSRPGPGHALRVSRRRL